jgi:MoaA/NifB/PqqE/SkfB family radical SAM enzyme
MFIHSHLPPLNSPAFGRFVKGHLLNKASGPSHAQIGLTNACPQRCRYCYSRDHKGRIMDTDTIKAVIRSLKAMGVFWLGFTGGEPLLNKDIVSITGEAADSCAIKLFTTGFGLTPAVAADLRNAGLSSVSVSLDHWREDVHDRARGFAGAFRTALAAIKIFQDAGGLNVGVSAVLSREMIRRREVEEFLAFLEGLGLDEAWLSETKPSVESVWNSDGVIREDERKSLLEIQDRWNRGGGLTVNYLGHFESGEHFGCTAGHKMVYVDAFGDIRPCVFIPLTFGNVRERPLGDICADMRRLFPTEDHCFINRNFEMLRPFAGRLPVGREDSLKLVESVRFGPLAGFFRLHFR